MDPLWIQDYAVLGDCRTAALVARDGSIDWLCWPRFDSPSIFAALLDRHGGTFRIAPLGAVRTTRQYEEGSNVLVTESQTPTGTVRVTDWMTVPFDDEEPDVLVPEHEIVRLAECLGGEVDLELVFDPRPGYGSRSVRFHDGEVFGWRAQAHHGAQMLLRSEATVAPCPEGGLRGRARLRSGQSIATSLAYSLEAPAVLPPLGAWTREALRRTVAAWRSWSDEARYEGPHRRRVLRSVLALKLLAFAPSGAIIAAPTTSLPERAHGDLNWDYRYCWLRDASLTARAFFGLGYTREARAFVSWLLHTTRLTRPRLHVLYDVFGRLTCRERTLPLEGFQGAKPVRVGNAAQDQLQLDVYGEVIDATVQFVRRGGRIDRETQRALGEMGEFVCRHWDEADEGIWEVRSGRAPHTHSRVLCWAALDRLLGLHEAGQLSGIPIDEYRRQRDALRFAIEVESWSDALGSYIAVPGRDAVDATLLLLPLYGFEPADSARMRSTWKRIRQDLAADGDLLFRYRSAESPGEGAFGACAFWAAAYLAEGGGSLEEAETLFDSLVERANDVGLFAEEIEPVTGNALGNFPQGFTHVALINAALAIEARRAREEEREVRPMRAGQMGGAEAHL